MTKLFTSVAQWATQKFGTGGRDAEESIGPVIIDWLKSNLGFLIAPTAAALGVVVVCCILLCVLSKIIKRKNKKIQYAVVIATMIAILASTAVFGYYSVTILNAVAATNNSASNHTEIQSHAVQDTLNAVVDQSFDFVDASIRQMNTTVLTLCWQALPNIQSLMRDMGDQLLTALSSDSRLTPLFDLLDKFLATVHLMVSNMEAISQARSGVLAQLQQLTGLVSQLQSDVNRTVGSVCAPGSAFADSTECSALKELVPDLTIGPHASRVDTDISVSLVTLQRLLNLNITQLDILVVESKATLKGLIGSVDELVEKLLNELIGTASREFQLWLSEIDKVGDGVRAQVSGSDIKLYLLYVSIGVAVVLALSLLFWVTIAAGGGCFIQLGRRTERHQGRPGTDPLKRVTAAAFALSFILVSALLPLGCFMLTAGLVAEREVAAPMTTESGRRELDHSLDGFIRDAGWPLVRQFLQNITNIPLPFNLPEKLPNGILQSMLDRCGPPKRETLPEILNLLEAVNSSRFVNSDLVAKQLAQLSQSLTKELRKRSSESLISKKTVADLVSQLNPFVNIVDSADYSSSISELLKQLLRLNDTQLLTMIEAMKRLGQVVLKSNSTDFRGSELIVKAKDAQSVRSERGNQVAAELKKLRKRFVWLQNNRVLGNLTAQLLVQIDDFRVGFDSLVNNLSLVDLRFNQSVNAASVKAVRLLDRLLREILASSGHCDGLLPVFKQFSDLSSWMVGVVWRCGLCLLISSLLFFIGYFVNCAQFLCSNTTMTRNSSNSYSDVEMASQN